VLLKKFLGTPKLSLSKPALNPILMGCGLEARSLGAVSEVGTQKYAQNYLSQRRNVRNVSVASLPHCAVARN
jgi:hypothetical protein